MNQRQPSPDVLDHLITMKEAVAKTKVSRRTLERFIERKLLPTYRIGSRVLLDSRDLIRCMSGLD